MSYKTYVITVPGKSDKEIFLFALSTCVWCRKTKALMKELGLNYRYVDMDLLAGEDRDEAYSEMEKYNPDANFPTIIINNGEDVILGYREEEIKKL
jgi:glutaredoxin-like protein NrdH